jgi:hypothetical protein
MSIKSRFATIIALPAGGVWLLDSFIANMPLVVEGGLFVAGIAGAAIGVEGCRKLLHSATAAKPAEQEQAAPAPSVPQPSAQAAPQWPAPAPAEPFALPSAVAREQLLRAYQMGAAAQSETQRLER